jgi:glutamine amidotransferase
VISVDELLYSRSQFCDVLAGRAREHLCSPRPLLSVPVATGDTAMKLFAIMCNQPQRLLEAIAPVRASLVAQPPIARWGLGYVQSGEVLLARTPRPSSTAIDLYAALEGVNSDCVLGHAVTGGAASSGFGGTDDTPPFRYRRWMFVQDGPVAADGSWEALAAQVPDYLRRNIKGKSAAEISFHVLLAMLHDLGGIDDANLPLATTRRAVSAASALVSSELTKAGVATPIGNLAVSNGRSMLVARIGAPLWMRRLQVFGERGKDEQFRGVIFVSGTSGSGGEQPSGDGFEEIPTSSVVSVSRDLRIDVASLGA